MDSLRKKILEQLHSSEPRIDQLVKSIQDASEGDVREELSAMIDRGLVTVTLDWRVKKDPRTQGEPANI